MCNCLRRLPNMNQSLQSLMGAMQHRRSSPLIYKRISQTVGPVKYIADTDEALCPDLSAQRAIRSQYQLEERQTNELRATSRGNSNRQLLLITSDEMAECGDTDPHVVRARDGAHRGWIGTEARLVTWGFRPRGSALSVQPRCSIM
jgi:hypothetical protein